MILNGLADGCIVINLNHRKDKYLQIMEECNRVGISFIRQPGVIIEENLSMKGHFGCGLAHINAYKNALDMGWDSLLILEDDAVFVPSFLDWVDHINDFFTKYECDLFYFWTD